MRTPVAVGVIGLERRGVELAAAFDELQQAELRWLCDEQRDLRLRVARRFRSSRMTDDAAELLADESLDAVVIGGGEEPQLVRRALEADKHVFVTPPLAHTAAEAEVLVRLARSRGRSLVVGDVMADVCFRLGPVARERSAVLRSLGLAPRVYVAATLHRDANVVQPRLGRILSGLGRLDEPAALAAHPRTRGAIERDRIELAPNVRLLEPLPYLDFAALASQARVIVTDSGGVQKEAYWYAVPCVTARPSTEWVDTVELGANVLVDDDSDRLVAAVAAARLPDALPPLYGDGHAAERIAEAVYTLTRA
jgi:UDP-N-acetylglucosamine 2-epimerase